MSIREWSRDVILVSLSPRSAKHDELQKVAAMVQGKVGCNVAVDFSRIDVAGCAMLTRLIELRRLLRIHRHRLILYSLAPATHDIFRILRLDRVFDIAKDETAVLACLSASDGSTGICPSVGSGE